MESTEVALKFLTPAILVKVSFRCQVSERKLNLIYRSHRKIKEVAISGNI